MKSISIHSNKGGVGKTTISINMAMHLVKQGKNVVLLDHDFSGPALFTFFDTFLKNKDFKYINEYFDRKVKLDEVLIDFSDDFNIDGRLYVGLADPSPSSIDRMLRLDERGAGLMLAGLAKLRRDIQKEPFNADILIIDAAPGIGLTSINTFVNSDVIIFVIKLSNADIYGTVNMIYGLIEELGRRITMIANQIPLDRIADNAKRAELEELISSRINEVMEENEIEFLGWVPTDTELQKIEFDKAVEALRGKQVQREIFTYNQPDHPFTKDIDAILKKLLGA